MVRRLSVAASLVIVLGAQGAASAQFAYPPGYSAWGWNGWGGSSSVPGDTARGLGVFAAGAGIYNQETAVANSINADTTMRWNEYIYQSQQVANRRYQEKLARDKANRIQARQEIYDRLRNNPSQSDIARGDALNVALDEISNPKLFAKSVKLAAGTKLGGELIRDIPFQYASAAITTSVHDLTQSGPPPSLQAPEFTADREALMKLVADLREQDEEKGQLDPATIQKAKDLIKTIQAKVEAKYKPNTRERNEAERRVKAAYGLMSMLETPAIDLLLAGVENRPDANLGQLLTFMHSVNLRFGVAKTNRQREVYNTLYPLLTALRDQVVPNSQSAVAEATDAQRTQPPAEFFEGMNYQHLDAKKGPKPK
jgi:hypothetical protein